MLLAPPPRDPPSAHEHHDRRDTGTRDGQDILVPADHGEPLHPVGRVGFPADHRAARFEEALQIIGPLLRGERLTFAGRYHQIRDAVLLPPPDRPIPILVAGNRPRMLRLTARYADAWNTAWFGLPDMWLGQRLAGLHAALQAENRDPATLRRTVGMDCELADPGQTGGGSFAGPAGELARAIDAYERLGIDDLIVRLQPSTQPALDRLARAIQIRGH